MTQVHIPDGCCGKSLSKALRDGQLDAADMWNCPRCGMAWQPRDMPGDVRVWEPKPIIEVWRGRR